MSGKKIIIKGDEYMSRTYNFNTSPYKVEEEKKKQNPEAGVNIGKLWRESLINPLPLAPKNTNSGSQGKNENQVLIGNTAKETTPPVAKSTGTTSTTTKQSSSTWSEPTGKVTADNVGISPGVTTQQKETGQKTGGMPLTITYGRFAKNRMKSAVSSVTKNPLNGNVFDDIDEKDIEKNRPLAENTIKTNVEKGLLPKDYDKKYPYLRDGLSVLYAADEENNKKAVKEARKLAYMERLPENPEFKSSLPKTNEQNLFKEVKNETKTKNNLYSETKYDGILLNNTAKDMKDSKGIHNIDNSNTVSANKLVKVNDFNNEISLSGQDLLLPQEAKKELIEYKKQYKEAEKELNYLAMNDIHKKSAQLRKEHYDYKDDYDYTHGGLIGIYTNYDDSYDENGHYEHVFKISSDKFGEFYKGTGDNYKEYSDSSVAGAVLSGVAGAASAALKAAYPAVAVAGTAISALSFVIQLAAADLKESEVKAFKKMRSYCENELTEIKDDDVEIYVYMLNGGCSDEMKIRAVKKSTGETLSEAGFDLKQNKPFSAVCDSLKECAELVSVNRRFWQYSYVNK